MKKTVLQVLQFHLSRKPVRAAALAAMLAIGAAWPLGAIVLCIAPVGVAVGQSLRINLANISEPGGTAPISCDADFKFLDSKGVVLQSSAIRSLMPGETAGFIIEGGKFLKRGARSTQIRVTGDVRSVGDNVDPGPCRSSIEVIDVSSERTTLYIVPEDRQ